jgi:hypothetical protein
LTDRAGAEIEIAGEKVGFEVGDAGCFRQYLSIM